MIYNIPLVAGKMQGKKDRKKNKSRLQVNLYQYYRFTCNLEVEIPVRKYAGIYFLIKRIFKNDT